MGLLSRPVLRTERLRLEPLGAQHLEDLVALDADPEVLRLIFGRARSRAEVEAVMPGRMRADADARGLGFWVGYAGDRFVGWWCLDDDDDRDPDAAELGYRLRRDAWGQGYAAEGAAALVVHGFDTVGLHRIWAETMAVNTRSRRVMEKLGLVHVESRHEPWPHPVPGVEEGQVVYEITRGSWEQQAWDAEAASFDEAADHGLTDRSVRSAWRELLLRLLPPAPARVADLGCGTGTLSLLLAESGYEVTGLDFSPEMLVRARAKAPTVTFVEGDAADPGLEHAAYDAVLCRHVLWALPDPVAVLRRWTALLSPGGRLVLVEGHWSNGAGLSAEKTLDLLRAAGRDGTLTRLPQARYWGREIADERYAILA